MNQRTLAAAFGAAVRKLRADQGHSQEGFAHVAGLSRTYMSEVERGVTNVSLETIARVAGALDVPLTTLFAEVERQHRR